MVLLSPAPDVYEAHSVDGAVALPASGHEEGWAFDIDAVEGRDPLADQDPTRFTPLDAEMAVRYPDRRANSYPFAWEHVAQVFDHPCAPDLCVVHTAAHRQEATAASTVPSGWSRPAPPSSWSGPGSDAWAWSTATAG